MSEPICNFTFVYDKGYDKLKRVSQGKNIVYSEITICLCSQLISI